MLGEKAECLFDSIPQLKPQGSPSAGWEGSMCNSSPAFVHILNSEFIPTSAACIQLSP